MRGILRDLRGAPDQAVADFRRAVEVDADNEDAAMRLTELLVQAHQPAEALPHLQYLLKALPDDPRVLTRIARCRADMGQAEEAKRILDGVLARYPYFSDALDQRGSIAMQDGDLTAAEGWLREAAGRDLGSTEARYHLYRCLVAEGKDAEAKAEQARLDALEADLKEIHELITGKMQRSPNDPALRTHAGVIALQAGVPEDGVRWLESALEIDPHYAPAHQALAEYYKQIGDRARSAQHLSEAKSAPADAPKP